MFVLTVVYFLTIGSNHIYHNRLNIEPDSKHSPKITNSQPDQTPKLKRPNPYRSQRGIHGSNRLPTTLIPYSDDLNNYPGYASNSPDAVPYYDSNAPYRSYDDYLKDFNRKHLPNVTSINPNIDLNSGRPNSKYGVNGSDTTDRRSINNNVNRFTRNDLNMTENAYNNSIYNPASYVNKVTNTTNMNRLYNNNRIAFEGVTGHNNKGLYVALQHGPGGLSGLSGAAGLEGGLGLGKGSTILRNRPVLRNAMNSIHQIKRAGGPSGSSNYGQIITNQLSHDISNQRIGGMVGAAALNGYGGLTGAAGLGKIVGNEPGFGSNLGALNALATSIGVNGRLTMSPQDLGSEGKETLGGASLIASEGQLGTALGIKAGIEAGITDQGALQTLAGLGQGQAIANALSNLTMAMKAQGIEGPATRVAGYAGIPGSGGFGSYSALLGMGPTGAGAVCSRQGVGKKGGSSVSENIAFNLIALIKKLGNAIREGKENVVENTLKKKMMEQSLEAELKD